MNRTSMSISKQQSKMSLITPLIVVGVIGLCLSNASAAQLLGWDAGQSDFNDRISSVYNDPYINSETITFGGSLEVVSGDNIRMENWYDGTLEDAVDNTSCYFSFTVEPTSSDVSFDIDSISWRHYSGDAADFALLADLDDDGWDTEDQLSSEFNPNSGGSESYDPAFDNIGLTDQTEAVEFRIYGITGGSERDNADRIQDGADFGGTGSDFSVDGTAIPEPTTAMLLALSGLLLMKRRPRRRA